MPRTSGRPPTGSSGKSLASARWTVTCTASGFEHLSELAAGRGNVQLSYHGLDLARFGAFAGERSQPRRLRSAGAGHGAQRRPRRREEGLRRPAQGAGACCRPTCTGGSSISAAANCWPARRAGSRARHRRPRRRGRAGWRRTRCSPHYRQADIFALACRITADGDRDGLPNVLVEASSQGLRLHLDRHFRRARTARRRRQRRWSCRPTIRRRWRPHLSGLMRDPALRQRARRGRRAKGADRISTTTAASASLTGLFEREWQTHHERPAHPLLRPASARHRPPRPRQPGRRRARRGRISR